MEKQLDAYLEKVEKYLKPMPVSERIDIVQEIESEISELQNEGNSVEEILGRFGNARELARAYLERVITGAGRGKAGKQTGAAFWPGWRKLCALAAFYSLAGVGGMFVLPFTTVLGIGLMICGILAPVAGLIKFLGYLMGFEVPWVLFSIETGSISFHVENLWILPVSIFMGVVFFLLGKLLWALTVRLVHTFSRAKRRIG